MLREVEDLAGPFEGWCGGNVGPASKPNPVFAWRSLGDHVVDDSILNECGETNSSGHRPPNVLTPNAF